MTTPREQLEQRAQAVGRAIDGAVNQNRQAGRIGFALFVFDFGDAGNLSYVSNAERPDMVKAVKEWLARQQAGIFTDPPEGVPVEKADVWIHELAEHLVENLGRLEPPNQVLSLSGVLRTVARIASEQALREVGAGGATGARA